MVPIFSRRLRSIRRKAHQKLYLSRQTQDYLTQEALTALFYLTVIISVHTYAMVVFEGLSIKDAAWLTTTSITTVGYGDISAKTDAGRLSTTILIFFGGIFVLGKIAGDFIDFRSSRRTARKSGHWSYNRMKNHIVIIGSKADSEIHIQRLVAEFERNSETAGQDVVLVTESFGSGLPYSLHQQNIKFVNGHGSDPTFLKQAGVTNADIIIILAWDENKKSSDGHAFDVINRIREMGSEAKIVAECVENSNRPRLTSSGATLVLRPIRAYPEMIVGGLLNTGSLAILENLFTASGESIFIEEKQHTGSWAEIVSTCVSADKGVPIAYRSAETGDTVTSPAGSSQINADAIFVLRSE